jgi:hypothetical protein
VTTQYYITSVADLLKVPADRREACAKELLLLLDLVDLANGDSDDVQPQAMVWTDDGDKSVTLEANGETLLMLKVEPATPAGKEQ